TILGIGNFIEDPPRTIAEAIDAFGNIGQLITSTPELCERFLNMPLGDQIELVSKAAVTLALAKGFAGTGGAAMRSGGVALERAGAVAVELSNSTAAAGFVLELDLAAAAVAAGKTGFGLLAPLAVSPLLAEAGDLPPLSEKAEAALKRASRLLS